MKVILFILLLTAASVVNAGTQKDLAFELFPQTRSHIYSVGIMGENRWYQLEWKVFKNGAAITKTCDIFYDSISKNFYCTINNTINIIPINQPYEIHIKKKK